MNKPYPDECPAFRALYGDADDAEYIFAGQGPNEEHGLKTRLIAQCVPSVNASEKPFEWMFSYYLDRIEPLTITAVLMYEACGGTFEMLLAATEHRRGPKREKLFARAHAYAAMCAELGKGC